MIEVGTVINNRLRVDKVLGEGGMGVVVMATHLELGHRVAIKFLRDEIAQNGQLVERFLREARAVVNLRTEHVCRVMDVGRLDSGAPYIVMEMLDGADLQRVVAKQPLPLTTAVEYVMQACVALAEAHQAGIIHRDLKPANLFVTRRLDGGPLIKVLDFGIAKALAETSNHLTSASPMGSPGYMSPEQIHSARDVDVRTDIWALGVTLYQLLSARMPFNAPTMTEMAIRVGTDPPEPLDLPPALHAIVWKCLEKDRSRRYADVAELARDLVQFGGPSARAIANTVTQITTKTSSEPPQPVLGSAPTIATGVQNASRPGVANDRTPVATAGFTERVPKHSRAPLVAVSIVAIVGAGIGIGYAVRGNGGAPQQVAVVRDAATPSVALDASEGSVPTVDAAPKPDAGGLTAIADRANDPKLPKTKPTPKTPKLTPNPATPTSGSASTQPTEPSKPHPVWEAACSKVSSRFAALAPPGLITKCMCLKGDRAAAQEAYKRISKDDREGPRTECARYGIKLGE